MRWRAIQPAVFGLAVLSFLLPFANVSCATDPDIGQTGTPIIGSETDEGPAELKGYELAAGRGLDGELAEAAEGFAIRRDDVRFGGEPFAVLALAAALAGVGAAFVSSARTRTTVGLVAGTTGSLSVVVLGLAPVLRTYGVLRVSWTFGYWVCLALFAGATAFSYLEHRAARPPPYLRE